MKAAGNLEPLPPDNGQLIRPQDSWTRAVQNGEDLTFFNGFLVNMAGIDGHSRLERLLRKAFSGWRAL